MARDEQKLREEIVAAGQYLLDRGLVFGTAGNISARIDESRFVLTPSGMDYRRFGPADLCLVNLENGEVAGTRRPSVEIALHATVYRIRPDVGAVVHTHSKHATAVACARRELPCILDAMAVQFGGPVPVAKYAIPGSKDLADNATRSLGDGGAVLIANHGVLAVGADLSEAIDRAELVERSAEIFLLAGSAGKAVPLDTDSIRWIQAFFRTSYGQHPGRERSGE